MKLYHYIPKDNTIKTDGLQSFAKSKTVNLKSYLWRDENLKTQEDVIEWLEKCFTGRSRGIRFFTEPIKWNEQSVDLLKNFAENNVLISVDVDKLDADGLIESIYVSPPLGDKHPECLEHPELMGKCDEFYEKLASVKDIDFSPVDWSICNDKLGRRFAYVRYYLLVIKDGLIPPEYITTEKQNML